MTSPWVYAINVVLDGEFVRSKTINRPLNQIISRTQYLYDILGSISDHELVVAPNVSLDPDTVPGTPVYYREADGRFAAALAEVEVGDTNYGFPTEKAELRGIVLVKHSTNTGDIALYGKIKASIYDNIDWSLVSETGTQPSGNVFVSASEEGKISTSKSALSVRIGTLDGNGNLYFQPDISGDTRNHLHYKFQLTENLGASISDEGWLEAAVFTANGISVPSGYTHGYNVAEDSELSARFPPTPVVAHNLFINGALAEVDEDYTVDANGIWVNGVTPWNSPTFFVSTELSGSTTIVSSLQSSSSDIPVSVVNLDDDPASTGDIYLKLLASNVFAGDPVNSETALSTEIREDGKFKKTPVISRILPGSNISVESQSGNDTDGHYGTVTISSGSTGSIQIQPTLAELNNTTEDVYRGVPVLSFPAGRSSTSVVYKIAVPTNMSPNRKVALKLDLVAAALVSDSIDVSYKVISPGTLMPTDFTDSTAVAAGITAINTPNTVDTDKISVQAGDTVLIKLTQPLTSPSYDLMILKALAVISS